MSEATTERLVEVISDGEKNSPDNPLDEEEALRPTIDALRAQAVDFVKNHTPDKSWLLGAIVEQRHLDGIIAEMRHSKGGQEWILDKLKKLKPDIQWYRGGTMVRWGDQVGSASRQYFTDDQLNTLVIDGGKNGILGQPSVARSFLKKANRDNPVLYTLSLDAMIEGLKAGAIGLTTEHDYDLNVVKGNNTFAYLDFCKNNLKIEQVKLQ